MSPSIDGIFKSIFPNYFGSKKYFIDQYRAGVLLLLWDVVDYGIFELLDTFINYDTFDDETWNEYFTILGAKTRRNIEIDINDIKINSMSKNKKEK